jgi:hypothetical protein
MKPLFVFDPVGAVREPGLTIRTLEQFQSEVHRPDMAVQLRAIELVAERAMAPVAVIF